MSSFGERLKTLRTNRGLSQDDLCNELNTRYGTSINKSMISKWENNKEEPRMEYARKLVNYFNVSLDYLLGLKDSEIQHINNDEALEYLDEIHKRPEMKTLFSVSRKATKEDIETAITLIEALKRKSGNED